MNRTSEGDGRVWVIGLGTALGDDRAGWELVALLQERLPAGVRCSSTNDPLCVMDVPVGCERLVVIDACRGAGLPGSLHRFEWPDPRLAAVESLSSHGIGLAAALELAASLERLPPKVVILSIEVAPEAACVGVSLAVEAAMPEFLSRVLAEISP